MMVHKTYQKPSARRVHTPEAATYIGVHPGTLKRMVSEGRGPAVIRIGRRVVFDTGDLDAYLDAHRYPGLEGD